MSLVKLSDEWKSFLLGAGIGGVVTYFGPKAVKKLGHSIGDYIADRAKPGLNPSNGDPSELYNRIISTLNGVDTRLDNLEKTVYQKGG
jgi:hypothetical protein